MSDFTTRVTQLAADTNRKASQISRPGVIYEHRKGMARIVLGQSPTGELYLSPWIHPDQHRGMSREGLALKKNQNVMVHCPNGDPAQAYFTPLSPNDEIPRPDHAETAGEEADTFQLENLRVRKDKDTYDIWLTSQAGTVSGSQAASSGGGTPSIAGGSGQSQTPPVGKYQAQDTSCGEGTKAVMKLRINKNGYITGRIGTDVRFAAHAKGAKIWSQGHYYVVRKDEPPYLRISEPPVIAPDGIPNDDS